MTLRDLRTATGYSRSAMNKHRDYLVERKLVRERPKTGDGRMIHLGCTDRGKRELEEIDEAIEVDFMKTVGFGRRNQLRNFSIKLEEALLDFPCEQKPHRRAYAVPTDKQTSEEQTSVPILRFVQPSEQAVSENSR